ncbi:hypothetical protein [Streptomyces sp. NPDC127039]|uniref:hypothetical protein n=1 Tax=Streptomyces sp. NPDC127039 TaxID=3347115 RepID=UPI0036562D82
MRGTDQGGLAGAGLAVEQERGALPCAARDRAETEFQAGSVPARPGSGQGARPRCPCRGLLRTRYPRSAADQSARPEEFPAGGLFRLSAPAKENVS